MTDRMQKLPNSMTLATLRAHVWKGGADVMLYYKSNGRKPIKWEQAAAVTETPETENEAKPQEATS